jgi:hypothetical protein
MDEEAKLQHPHYPHPENLRAHQLIGFIESFEALLTAIL